MIQGIIFDMDGVLLDSEHCMRKSAILALSEWGIEAKHEDFIPYTGAGEDCFVGGVAELHGVPYDKAMKVRAYEIYVSICEDEVIRFENIPETFDKLYNMGFTMAIASSADHIKVEANLKAAGIDPRYVSAIVTGDDVTLKKPHPDAFLLAAEKLGLPAKQCIVIEDAINGVKAAHNAGMDCVAIPSSFSREELLAIGAIAVVEKTCMLPDALTLHYHIE